MFEGLRHISQYVGKYAMEPQCFAAVHATVRQMNLQLHLDAQRTRQALDDGETQHPGRSRGYALRDGVALVDLAGPMTKYGSSLSAGAATVQLRRALRLARNDPAVTAGLLTIDSPGGTVDGTADLADDIAAFAAAKPLVAHVSDLCASAAMWAGSQAPTLLAGRSAWVGSIGVYMVVNDLSQAYKAEGVMTYVVKTGAMKAAGVPGTEITAEQLAMWQSECDTIHAAFVADVARGRRMPAARIAALADGKVYPATQALELGLIDAIATIDEAFQLAAARGRNSRGQRP